MEKVLNLALKMEDQSIQLYSSAQEKVVNLGSRQFLKELTLEEERHKRNIFDAMNDPDKVEEIGSLETKIQDLKIVDKLVDVSLSSEADYQQILIYAAKREKKTHDFYIELAKKYREKQIGKMFIKLAQEELKHKHQLEREYDEVVLKEM